MMTNSKKSLASKVMKMKGKMMKMTILLKTILIIFERWNYKMNKFKLINKNLN